jgi:hypothetical protein
MNWTEILASIKAIGTHGVTALVAYLFAAWNTKRTLLRGADKQSFEQLTAALPNFNQIDNYYNALDLKGSFQTKIFHQFHSAFESSANNPHLAFHNKELQKSVREIFEKSHEVIHTIGLKTFPVRGTDEQSIRRLKYGDRSDDFETGETLNKLTSEIFDLYKSFIERVRKTIP